MARTRGAEGKLTLVSAPAGFGKTTLLAEWLAAGAAGERPTACLTRSERHRPHALLGLLRHRATQQNAPVVQGTANLYLGLSERHLERGDLEGATELLQRSGDLGEEAAYELYEYRSRVAKARMKEARGDRQAQSTCSTTRSACIPVAPSPTCAPSRR